MCCTVEQPLLNHCSGVWQNILVVSKQPTLHCHGTAVKHEITEGAQEASAKHLFPFPGTKVSFEHLRTIVV